MTDNAMQCRHPLGKLLIQRLAVAANDGHAGAECWADADAGGAKPSAEDKEIDFVCRVPNHDGVFSDGINSLAVRVDECDVGEVKAWEIIVVKTRSLAPA